MDWRALPMTLTTSASEPASGENATSICWTGTGVGFYMLTAEPYSPESVTGRVADWSRSALGRPTVDGNKGQQDKF